jgi:hypothetical protein
MPVIETSIHKASGFSTFFFHTLIKQRQPDIPGRYPLWAILPLAVSLSNHNLKDGRCIIEP